MSLLLSLSDKDLIRRANQLYAISISQSFREVLVTIGTEVRCNNIEQCKKHFLGFKFRNVDTEIAYHRPVLARKPRIRK